MDKKNSLINLGCRLNIYEGEIIKNHLKKHNLKNITVINSCAVTAEAEKKVGYEIRRAKRKKLTRRRRDKIKQRGNRKIKSIQP